MSRAEIVARWNAGIAALRRRGEPLPRLSWWAWAADAILALILLVAGVNAVRHRDASVDLFTPKNAVGVWPGSNGSLPPVPPQVPDLKPVWHQYAAAEPWQVALAVLAAVPLLLRRRYPLAAFWVVLIAAELLHRSPGFDPTPTFAACVIAGYGAVMYSPYRVPAMASVLAGTLLLAERHDSSVPTIEPALVVLLFLIPLGLAANAVHTWKQRVRTLELEREAATRRAVDQERSRIARELHDVVTHNVSVMVVQAGAARKVMDASPDQAREALLAIESGGRSAMTELRHAMGLLTMTGEDLTPDGGPRFDPEVDLAPQPGFEQIPALVARIRDAGVPVVLAVAGRPVALSAGIGLAAYRVVQEALTNTVKHAVGASVKITIDYLPDAVRVEVTDTGGTPGPSARAGEHRGQAGLRERLAVYGGTLECARRPTGGYRVRAVIPLGQP